MEQQQIEQQMELTREEEQFLIEAEQDEQKKPCFDARALRQMGLSEAEVSLVQVFFMKARGAEFNIRRFTKLECLRALVFALRFLPRTGESGTVNVESYKASDNIYTRDAGKWAEGFRHEYGHALIWSHKERREPVLLAILAKVFDWVEKFQKAYGLYQTLPQWLQDGMAGDFRADSWIGSDFYEGGKRQATDDEPVQEAPTESQPQAPASAIPVPQQQQTRQATLFCAGTETPNAQPQPKEQCALATEKQKALIKKLLAERNMPLNSLNIDKFTKKEASRRIDELLRHSEAEVSREASA